MAVHDRPTHRDVTPDPSPARDLEPEVLADKSRHRADAPVPDPAVLPDALFEANEADGFRSRWEAIQTGFVDEPRAAVEQADALVDQVTTRLTEVFKSERSSLEQQWGRGDNVSTEDLRIALKRYRSFFERLLSM